MSTAARFLGAMRVVEDRAEVASAGGWVLAATHGWGVVHALVPDGFEAYARVFHPALREADERDLPLTSTERAKAGRPVQTRGEGYVWCEVTWLEVADANGRVAHPAMEWTAITGSYDYSWRGSQDGVWDQVPQRGSLPLRLTRELTGILAAFTSTAESCWFAVWEGNGDLVGLRADSTLPRLAMKNREMILSHGPLALMTDKPFDDGWASQTPKGWAMPTEYRSPNLWWPEDRTWCVATDVDLQTTYVGGSAACIAALLASDEIEALPATADQSVTFDADTINPTPAGDRANL